MTANISPHGPKIDPAIENHYDTGYERSRLFPEGIHR
jgi:hypothetical protein